MRTKALIWTNSVAGLAGGLLLLAELVLLILLGATFLSQPPTFTAFSFLFTLLKLGIIGLGLLGHIYYKGVSQVKNAAHTLFMIGGGLALIPWVGGLIGGIIVLVGAVIYFLGALDLKDTTHH